MKQRNLYIILLLLIINTVKAQDSIDFSVMIDHASCNLVPDGKVEVNVVPLHPPYHYLWDFGATTNAIDNIPAGDYSLTITDDWGTDTTIIVKVRASGGICRIHSEPAFTPNGDGFNDVWALENIEHYPDNSIVVFNVWGQKVFESHGVYVPWDGTDLAGIPVPENSYFYIILTDKKNEDTIVKGSISVIR